MSVQVTIERINSLGVLDIVQDEAVRQRFITIYGSLWGEQDAEAAYEREAIHFNRLLNESEALRKCTKMSIFIAFIDLAVCGLSLEPGVRALAYLQGRRYKVGQDAKGNDAYEPRINLTISGYGELVFRQRAGQIRHADNPVIVYEGDEFTFSDRGDVKKVEYTMNIHHNADNIIACYMRITRADGSIDYAVMLPEDWGRLQGYSSKANRKWDNNARTFIEKPNELYTNGRGGGIDTGFLMAKCIKHAFRTYPKIRIGRGTVMEADVQPEPNDADIYGLTNDPNAPSASHQQPTSFAPAPDMSAGVTINPANDAAKNDDTF